jgi:hypothetical protein
MHASAAKGSPATEADLLGLPEQGRAYESARGYLEILAAQRGEIVRAEPFAAVELPVGVLFGDDEDEA